MIDSGNVHGYLLEYAYAHQADLGFRLGDIIKFTPSQVADILAKMSTIDAVEVVRCKDCIYFDKYTDCIEMYQWDGFCADWARKTYENWFCSRAERRSDE